MEKTSDSDLVGKILSGNISLYSKIVERYQNPLLRYVSFLTNKSGDSEDVVQETFIKVYKNLRKYNPKLKFSSWIYRIAHNEAVNYIKKKKLVLVDHQDEMAVNKISNFKIPETSNIQMDKIQVEQMLNKLPLKYKEPVELYYIEGYSYSEISDILRIPIGTVGVRIKRAIALLKNQKLKIKYQNNK